MLVSFLSVSNDNLDNLIANLFDDAGITISLFEVDQIDVATALSYVEAGELPLIVFCQTAVVKDILKHVSSAGPFPCLGSTRKVLILHVSLSVFVYLYRPSLHHSVGHPIFRCPHSAIFHCFMLAYYVHLHDYTFIVICFTNCLIITYISINVNFNDRRNTAYVGGYIANLFYVGAYMLFSFCTCVFC